MLINAAVLLLFFLTGSRVAFILVDSGIRLKIGCYLTESNYDVHQQTAS